MSGLYQVICWWWLLTVPDQEVQVHVVELKTNNNKEIEGKPSTKPSVSPIQKRFLSFELRLR